MKIIIDTDLAKVPGATTVDNITSITASSEDPSFLAMNLQNDFTTDLWKAASGTAASLTVAVSKGSAVELLNTNATSIAVTVGTGGEYELESGYELETGYELEDTEPVTTVYNLPGSGGRLWADYPEFAGPHIVKLALVAASIPSAGILRAGNVEEFNDPAYGINEGSNDYSIEKELNNGADYFRKRNVVRSFSGISIFETRANCFKLKHDIFDAVGPKPLAIRLVHNKITDDEFVLFAKRVDSPQIDFSYGASNARINLNLKEVV